MHIGNHENGEIEIVRSVPVFNNQYIEIFNDAVLFPSGKSGTYVRINNPAPFSIAVLPINLDGRIVLLRNFRHGARGWGYEVPKGGAEDNESAIEAAKRELLEETGLVAEKMVYLGDYADSPAVFSDQLKCYLGLNCHKCTDVNTEPTEAIEEIVLFTPDDYLNMSTVLDFKDAVTELLVYKYLKYLSGRNDNE